MAFREALLSGLAPDGGLYIPTGLPRVPDGWETWDYVDAVSWSLQSFGADEPGSVVREAAEMYQHPEVAALVGVGDRQVFELFWGPTLSFKDHALQILGRLLASEVGGSATVLGATSGDTGSAAIYGCRGHDNLEVFILFPEGMVTAFQRRQMTTVQDGNVHALAVRGTFDDCQRLVKQAFLEHDRLLAVNSINWARIAAQVGYYLYLAARMKTPFNVVVPTGNFGNALSCWTAKQMGVPIADIVLANNQNHYLSDVVTGEPHDEPAVVKTIAPAMDILVPSNFERFQADPVVEFRGGWATDEEIRATIKQVWDEHDYLLDPHTAAAWKVGEEFRQERPQVVVGTAHPAKFAEAISGATGVFPRPPVWLEDVVSQPERITTIPPDYSELDALLR